MRVSPARTGAVLLEVLVAMTIFAIASTAAMVRAAQARHAVALALIAEDHMTTASAFFDRVALWPQEDLDRHLGAHAQGRWVLEVERVTPSIYTLTLFDGSTRRELLGTMLYRSPVGGHVGP